MNDNIIYVDIKDDNLAILKYPEIDIEVNAFIGENGSTLKKHEGDNKTPLGVFELGIILGTHDKNEINTKLEYQQITKDMYWVDDINSKYYNTLVNINETECDWNSAEHLIEFPIQYEYIIEIKNNPENIPGKGSAIFLHCSNSISTHGCVAIDNMTMKKLIEGIDEETKIEIRRF